MKAKNDPRKRRRLPPYFNARRSTNHSRVPFAGLIRAAGGFRRREKKTRLRAGPLPFPPTKKRTWRARLKKGGVRVIRREGGFGAFRTPRTHLRFSRKAGVPGKSEARWPSSPKPKRTTSGRPCFPKRSRKRRSKTRASDSRFVGLIKKGKIFSSGRGTRRRKSARAEPQLLSGWFNGTKRSSPHNTRTRRQGIRFAQGGRPNRR